MNSYALSGYEKVGKLWGYWCKLGNNYLTTACYMLTMPFRIHKRPNNRHMLLSSINIFSRFMGSVLPIKQPDSISTAEILKSHCLI
jgi:hypothetical protein